MVSSEPCTIKCHTKQQGPGNISNVLLGYANVLFSLLLKDMYNHTNLVIMQFQ